MSVALYRALIQAHVPDELAQAAADSVRRTEHARLLWGMAGVQGMLVAITLGLLWLNLDTRERLAATGERLAAMDTRLAAVAEGLSELAEGQAAILRRLEELP